jgi:hypothetical protein
MHFPRRAGDIEDCPVHHQSKLGQTTKTATACNMSEQAEESLSCRIFRLQLTLWLAIPLSHTSPM